MMESSAHQSQPPDHRPRNPARGAKRIEEKESRAIASDQNATWAGCGCAVHGTGIAPAFRKMKLRRNPKRATAKIETSQARNPQINSIAVRRFLKQSHAISSSRRNAADTAMARVRAAGHRTVQLPRRSK